jgi:hypothetical protein
MHVDAEAVKGKEQKACCVCGTAFDLIVVGTLPGPKFVYRCRECERRLRRGF